MSSQVGSLCQQVTLKLAESTTSLCPTSSSLAACNCAAAGGSTYSDLRTGKQQLLVNYTAPFQKMIKALMAPNPEDRPSAAKVLSLPLLTRRGSPKEGLKSAVQGNYGGLVLKPSRLS